MSIPSTIKNDAFEYYNMGPFAPSVILLDDDLDTVAPHKEFLLERKISTLITRDHQVAIEAYKQQGNSAAYAFDNHMNKIRRVGDRDTGKGLAVGLAIVSHLTNDGTENTINHCATISGYTTEPDAQEIYDVLADNGQYVEKIDKNNIEDFARFITRYQRDFIENIEFRLLSQNIDAVRNSYCELSESKHFETDLAAMMGYVDNDSRKWLENQESIIRNSGSDIKERISALAYIKHGLLLHFDDVAEQTDWIRCSRAELGGSSAWELLTSGNLNDLFMVASFVNRVIG
jgi:hypothetical protein